MGSMFFVVIKLYTKNEKDSLYLWDFLEKICCITVIKSDLWIKYMDKIRKLKKTKTIVK